MKYGLINYRFPNYSLEQVLDYAHKTGFGYIQIGMRELWQAEESTNSDAPRGKLQPGYGYARYAQDSDDPAEVIAEVKKLLDKYEMKISGFGAGNDFLQRTDSALRDQVERMERVCKVALDLGVNLLVTEGGWAKEGVEQSKWESLIVEGLRGCKPFVERLGVHLAVDNHGIVTNNAHTQLRILDQVDSKNIGANLDTMNYRWAGHEVETINSFYDMIAPRVKHTHFKDGHGRNFEIMPDGELKRLGQYVGTALGEGELDLKHAIRALKNAGYDGVWCVEFEGDPQDTTEGYRKGLEFLKANVPQE